MADVITRQGQSMTGEASAQEKLNRLEKEAAVLPWARELEATRGFAASAFDEGRRAGQEDVLAAQTYMEPNSPYYDPMLRRMDIQQAETGAANMTGLAGTVR